MQLCLARIPSGSSVPGVAAPGASRYERARPAAQMGPAQGAVSWRAAGGSTREDAQSGAFDPKPAGGRGPGAGGRSVRSLSPAAARGRRSCRPPGAVWGPVHPAIPSCLRPYPQTCPHFSPSVTNLGMGISGHVIFLNAVAFQRYISRAWQAWSRRSVVMAGRLGSPSRPVWFSPPRLSCKLILPLVRAGKGMGRRERLRGCKGPCGKGPREERGDRF